MVWWILSAVVVVWFALRSWWDRELRSDGVLLDGASVIQTLKEKQCTKPKKEV